MNDLKRKLERYAIGNLSFILIVCYVIGFVIQGVYPNLLTWISLNPYWILKGQVWRLVTWVLIPPPSSNILTTVIMLFFYYSIGKSLERTWGDYYYNLYIFSGMFFTIIGAFLTYGMVSWFPQMSLTGIAAADMEIVSIAYISTYFINMSIFLAFAATFPDNMVLLMFFIPIKVKWLGIVYGVMLAYEAIQGDAFLRIVIGASLLNFGVFYLFQRKALHGSPRMRMENIKRQRVYKREVENATQAFGAGISKHKCAICGRTEIDSPDMQFRFCSKCNGNYEYCSEHIFMHTHVE